MAMFQSPATTRADDTETVLGSGVKISGNLASDGDVRIDGSFEKGELTVGGRLIIGEQGRVQGNVTAQACVIHGRVDGNIKADESVEIGATGTVNGEISSGGRLVIEAGGVFIGKSVMSDGGRGGRNLDAEIETDLATR